MAGNQGSCSGIGMEKCIIVARAADGAIGRGNALLWHISADLKMFKSLTMGCPVIMGRKTFLSIGRALPGRLNIVISSGFNAPDGVEVVHSLEEAFGLCADAQRCFVIGGGRVYRDAMPLVDRLFVTEVQAGYHDADTFFPEVNGDKWREASSSPEMTDEASGLTFRFVEYVRK